MVTSSFRESVPSDSMAGKKRWCTMGSAFTNPAPSLGPLISKLASMSLRPPAEQVAPNHPPGSSRGPARPTVTGRVSQMSPSFLGYPCTCPRTMAKSLSTQM